MQKSAKFKSQLDYSDIRVFGLITQLPIYRLAWLMNVKFNWMLERVGDIVCKNDFYQIERYINENQQDILNYPIMHFKNEIMKYEIDLFANRACSLPLLKDFRNIDYILMFDGAFDYIPENIEKELKSIESVQMAFNIPTQKISDRHILISYK